MARRFGSDQTNGPRATYDTNLDLASLSEWTVCGFLKTSATDPARGYFYADTITSTNSQTFLEWGDFGTGDYRLRCFVNIPTTSMQVQTVDPNFSTDTWYFWACVKVAGDLGTGSNYTWYTAELGDLSVASMSTSNVINGASNTASGTPTQTTIGNRPDGSRTLDGDIAYLTVYDAALSVANLNTYLGGDFTVLSGNIIGQPDLTLGGNGNDTVGDLGTVTFAGSPTPSAQDDPSLGNTITAESGTYSITGNNADTFSPFIAESGTYSITGNSVVLGAVEVFSDFATSNIDVSRTSITGQGTSTPDITIFAEPGTNTEGGTPSEAYSGFSGRVTGVLGKTPVFNLAIDDPTRVGGATPVDWRVWYTYDDPDAVDTVWEIFDNTATVSNDIVFSHDTAFTSDTVYFADQPRYSTIKARAFLDSISGNSFVSMPPSSTGSDFVHFSTTATNKVDGTVLPSIDMISYRISDDSLQPLDGSPKRVIICTGGQHASEEQGDYGLQALIELVLGGTSVGNDLLRNCEFFIYPIVNATGRDGGAYRATLQSGLEDEDPNREWATGTLLLEEVTAVRDAITADTGNNIDVLLDWHGRLDSNPASLFINQSDPIQSNFYDNVASYLPSVTSVATGSDSKIITNFYQNTYDSVLLPITVEGDGTISSFSEYAALGEAVAKALDDSFDDGDLGTYITPVSGSYTITGNSVTTGTGSTAILGIKIGGDDVTSIKYGTDTIDKVYYGSTLIWSTT